MLCPGIQVRGLTNHTLLIDLEKLPAEIICKDYRGQHRLSRKMATSNIGCLIEIDPVRL